MKAAWTVLADSQDVTAALRSRLISLTLSDKPGLESDELGLVVSDHDGAIVWPRRGVMLRLALGWQGQPLIDKGAYKVDEVSHSGPPDIITIKARAADFVGALKSQRDLSYHDQTLGDVLTQIAERNGVTPAVAPILAGEAIPHIDQTNESDANFLTRLGERYDAVATIKDGHLLFTPRGAGVTAAGGVLPTLTINRRSLDSHEFSEAEREGSVSGVQAQWRDHGAAETKTVVAGDEDTPKTLKRLYPTEAEAQAAAQADWSALQRGQFSLRLSLALGRADIVAGQPFVVTGFRPEITAVRWWAHEVSHTVDGSGGFTTSITAESAEPESKDKGADKDDEF